MIIRSVGVPEQWMVHQSDDALAQIAAIVIVPSLRHYIVHHLSEVLGPLLGRHILCEVVAPDDYLGPVVAKEVMDGTSRTQQ